MAYQTSNARDEFDRWSSKYDHGLLQKLFFKPSHRLLLEVLGPEHERILDVGCGTGRFAARVLKRRPDARVWGLDLSDRMLAFSQVRCQALAGRWHAVQGDSERLPFADDSFDAVTCTHSFHHYPHQDRVVAEMHRVLRPGGQLLILDGNRDNWWGRLIYDVVVVLMEGAVKHLAARAFRRMYRHAGFEDVRQYRRGWLLPVLLTVGRAVKPAAGGRVAA